MQRASARWRWCLERLSYYLLPRILRRQEQRRLLAGLRRRFPAATSGIPAPGLTFFGESGSSTAVETAYLQKGEEVLRRYHEVRSWPEVSDRDLQRKIDAHQEMQCGAAGARVDRVRRLRELARLEQMRGRELVACAYRLRALRLLGRDRHRDLIWLGQTLEANGFLAEAAAAEALYGVGAGRSPRCRQLLQNALENNRRPPAPVEFEILDDRRSVDGCKVSIIVSLYNAAAKLPCFLRALQTQTLLRKNKVEFVFIDSHSPAGEHAALSQTALECPIPYVFARTQRRETIQTAWNRAILLSRGTYLTFLGVDETIVPDGLAVLSGELDADPTLDWVQGNSLVTEVDTDGVFVNDVMLYDRTGYTPDHVNLETCYLSWVGALYRRSIHERFGYYDGTFGAAGDTEFKGRLLPFLKTKSVPQTLGVFLNYPDERTTASPKAEIEDLRAWYLHRTVAGVEYALQRRDPADAEKLLLLALHYRKSYHRHASTDLDYAMTLADYLANRRPGSPALRLADGVAELLEVYRALDDVTPLTPRHFADTMLLARETIKRVGEEHRALAGQASRPSYEWYNDNRHEQHGFFY